MRELKRQADPSIVIMLVGNKVDLASQRKVPRELAAEFARDEELLFAEASAKTGDGVEDFFMEIGEWRPTSRVLWSADGSAQASFGPCQGGWYRRRPCQQEARGGSCAQRVHVLSDRLARSARLHYTDRCCVLTSSSPI